MLAVVVVVLVRVGVWCCWLAPADPPKWCRYPRAGADRQSAVPEGKNRPPGRRFHG
jgi:hypothetical protein